MYFSVLAHILGRVGLDIGGFFSAGRINVHFKDEGVPKVQVAFQSGEVKVLEESQLMSEKALIVMFKFRHVFFLVSGEWDLYLAKNIS